MNYWSWLMEETATRVSKYYLSDLMYTPRLWSSLRPVVETPEMSSLSSQGFLHQMEVDFETSSQSLQDFQFSAVEAS